jgi:predicted ATPase
MDPSISIRELTFSGGKRIELEPDSVIVIVGPNNAGKSATLREITAWIEAGGKRNNVVTDLKLLHSGTSQDLLALLAPYRRPDSSTTLAEYQLKGLKRWKLRTHSQTFITSMLEPGNVADLDRVGENVLRHFWENPSYPSNIAGIFFYLADLASRFEAAEPAPTFNVAMETPRHPIQRLFADEALARRLSSYFQRAFGQELIVSRIAGRQIPLHCGQAPPLEPGEDRASPSYARKIAKLPLLHEQGDGMRSFAGCLLQSMFLEKSVVLIDEPEAFLHPPQARFLGTLLAKERPAGRQLVIATHSGDLLRGLLDANPSSLKVIRLTREGNVNHARELDAAKLRLLWSDPILRFSNTLDGLFHEQVVLCEADGDCRFYAAILEALQPDDTGQRRPDVMFTSTGGKHKMPTIIAALASTGVPTRPVMDFDVLNNESPLREAIEALGGSWSTFSATWKQVKAGVEKRRPELETPHIKKEIERVLNSVNSPTFPDVAVKQMQELLKRTSPWEEAKRVGLGAVPAGQERQMAERLLNELKQLGLFIVDLGVLESFDPTVSGHGNPWVAEVLRKDLRSDPHLEAARRFVRGLLDLQNL